jgi:hypothetical protein
LFTQETAPGLLSLNSHFTHYSFYPNDDNDVYATEVTQTTQYSGTLAFSVGCHSGLNVPDAAFSDTTGIDWAQAWTRQGATYLGNTGYGYGDADLLAYSERLMVNFVGRLGDWSAGPQTVGHALLRAKQGYFNTLAAGSFSCYDEKVISELTLYGLPMLQINLPVTTTEPYGGPSLAQVQALHKPGLQAQAMTDTVTATFNLHFDYTAHTTPNGAYYTLVGSDDVQVTGHRPVQPRASVDVARTDGLYAQGVLMTGGTFTEVVGFDPVVSRVVTETSALATEPTYPITDTWYPQQVGSLNRFLSIDAQMRERLVVVPGQFRAADTGSSTTGSERLYEDLSFDIYYAPF